MKQLDAVQIERLTEIKGQLLNSAERGTGPRARHTGGAACQPLVRDLLYGSRQGQHSRQRLHNHPAGNHRRSERARKRVVLRGLAHLPNPNCGTAIWDAAGPGRAALVH